MSILFFSSYGGEGNFRIQSKHVVIIDDRNIGFNETIEHPRLII